MTEVQIIALAVFAAGLGFMLTTKKIFYKIGLATLTASILISCWG
nr:MAG TPA: hypothetical protein [Caudoviricetes sp.]